jgi:hypothetical protein
LRKPESGEACLEESIAMQTGMEETGRPESFEALISHGAPKQAPEAVEVDSTTGEGFVRPRSALFGMRVALPLALGMWGLIAGLIWACSR